MSLSASLAGLQVQSPDVDTFGPTDGSLYVEAASRAKRRRLLAAAVLDPSDPGAKLSGLLHVSEDGAAGGPPGASNDSEAGDPIEDHLIDGSGATGGAAVAAPAPPMPRVLALLRAGAAGAGDGVASAGDGDGAASPHVPAGSGAAPRTEQRAEFGGTERRAEGPEDRAESGVRGDRAESGEFPEGLESTCPCS